jgi:hypothetical protein
VIAIASSVFAGEAYQAAQVSEIAPEAEVSAETIYARF